MSNESGTSGVSDENEILKRLAALTRNADQALADVRLIDEEIAAVATLPASGAVSATLDAEGRLTALEIDRLARTGLDGEALGYEINVAIARAAAEQPPRDPQETADELRGRPELDMEALLQQIFAGGTVEAATAEPTLFWNDTHTVGFGIVVGAIRSMEFSASWLADAPESSISAEIIRVAALAREDEERRRIEEGENNG